MAEIILIIAWAQLVLLLAFLIFSLKIKKIRKPLIISGLLFLVLGSAVSLLEKFNPVILSFNSPLELFLVFIGYFLLLFGFKEILKERKKK
jgi:hypothetical protein